ncbi:MAG: Mov34/MPN/PAD-1 family protein [Methanobrevibacter sp.]|uniref:Mov34/MPN/PAD-1 family protein n=1 Tax=Methanobrevibacter sp. TaxID=66852 RepID=UPI0026E09D4C|nr:Mov34/MPN/PAD-1 family protein [Methanobrevibacter sp.]MDO5848932.1 Mov34/MPN/PAD-1 family protein [Methanobrevibacter sp.]
MSFLSKIFSNDDNKFDEVRVDAEVLESVIYYSTQAFPNEFLALLDGEIKDNILYITGLIFLPGETCSTGAVFHSEMVPPTLKYWGSVHCHPGPSAQPSEADLKTFSKHGVFHMIVCLPYSLETFRAYDKYGDPMDYTVGDYSYLVEDEVDDFFDEDDVLKEGETFEPGFFDEDDDDEFFDD